MTRALELEVLGGERGHPVGVLGRGRLLEPAVVQRPCRVQTLLRVVKKHLRHQMQPRLAQRRLVTRPLPRRAAHLELRVQLVPRLQLLAYEPRVGEVCHRGPFLLRGGAE